MNVGILLFDDVEVLDFAGPFEVFSTAARLAGGTPRPFTVFTVAADAPVVARGGLRVEPAHSLQTHPPIDLLIVPGGVVTAELAKPAIVDWIRTRSRSAALTASVCTGAFLLAEAGLPAGMTLTTHWEDVDDFRSRYPSIALAPERRYVDAGAIVSSAGISAGLDMSLHLVARLAGEPLAVRTARQMDYRWLRDD